MLGLRPTLLKRFSPLLFSAVSFFLLIFLASLPSSWGEKKGFRKKRGVSFSGTITKGETFTGALLKQGLDQKTIHRLIRVLSPFLDFHRIRPGHSFTLTLDRQGRLKHFLYRRSLLEVYEVNVQDGKWHAAKWPIVLQRKVVAVSGTISSSLFESIEALGETPQLIFAFANLFAWDVDFHDSQPGDRFRFLVEKFYTGETFAKYGRILIAQYERGSRRYTGIHFQVGKGQGRYYDLDGRSLKKAFLRSPLRFTRISSGYNKARPHPILGGVRPHLAIDYAAPHGTPVWAVADGVVEFARRRGGNGNSITLRHGGGYKTQYNHLSRFAKGIRRRAHAKQGQVIGYVGATGLATGPHLDYRVMKGGRFVNPLTHQFPRGLPVPATKRHAFFKKRDALLARLEAEAPW